VNPRAGLDDVEKRKFLTLQGLEVRPLCHPTRSQSLYRLSYPGSNFTVCTTNNLSPFLFDGTQNLLPCLQGPVTSLRPKHPDEFGSHLHTFFRNIHFTTIHPSTPKSSKCSFSIRIPYQNYICIFFSPMRAT
jgi:hypothetical protein